MQGSHRALPLEAALDAKKNTKTIVQTRTLTERVTRTLTREEELVVRMTRGLSEGSDYALEFRGAGTETGAQLALIEASLLAEMYDVGPLAVTGPAVNASVKGRILDKLSKLSD